MFKLLINVLIILLIGWTSASLGANTVNVSGSTTMLPIVADQARTFNSQQIGCMVNVSGGGTSAGITAIVTNKSDIAMASVALTANEMNKYGGRLNQFVIGFKGVVIAVSKSTFDAGIKRLTTEQVKDIYVGKIRNWKELGGQDKPIYVIFQKPSGVTNIFNETIFNSTEANTPGVNIIEQNNTRVKTIIVSSDRAIGYLDFSYLASGNISAIALDGIMPSIQSIKNGDYKLSRPAILFYTYGKPEPCAKKFIDYVTSSKGQNITADYGYIPA
jgi:phosphate transport system substrate-binding protein